MSHETPAALAAVPVAAAAAATATAAASLAATDTNFEMKLNCGQSPNPIIAYCANELVNQEEYQNKKKTIREIKNKVDKMLLQPVQFSMGPADGPGLYASNTTTGVYSPATNQVGFTTGGNSAVLCTTSGTRIANTCAVGDAAHNFQTLCVRKSAVGGEGGSLRLENADNTGYVVIRLSDDPASDVGNGFVHNFGANWSHTEGAFQRRAVNVMSRTGPVTVSTDTGDGMKVYATGVEEKHLVFHCSSTFIIANKRMIILASIPANPQYSVQGDNGTGVFLNGLGVAGFSSGGQSIVEVNASAVTVRKQCLATTGSVTAPHYSFEGDAGTGLARDANGNLVFTKGGVSIVEVNADAVTVRKQCLATTGSAAAPQYSFEGDAGTGLARDANGNLILTKGGASILEANANAVTVRKQCLATTGSVAAPNYSFEGDAGTGMTRDANGKLVLAKNGQSKIAISDIVEVSGNSVVTGELNINNRTCLSASFNFGGGGNNSYGDQFLMRFELSNFYKGNIFPSQFWQSFSFLADGVYRVSYTIIVKPNEFDSIIISRATNQYGFIILASEVSVDAAVGKRVALTTSFVSSFVTNDLITIRVYGNAQEYIFYTGQIGINRID